MTQFGGPEVNPFWSEEVRGEMMRQDTTGGQEGYGHSGACIGTAQAVGGLDDKDLQELEEIKRRGVEELRQRLLEEAQRRKTAASSGE